jgi:two-component sensor histidine kinase
MQAQKKLYILLAFALVASMLLSACGGSAPAEPSQPEAPAATDAVQAPAATEAPAMSDKYGGILRHASQPVTVLDPAFLTSVPDDEAARQWHDFLIFIGEDNSADASRSIAESWEFSEDGLTWTFKLRQGVLFHDGKAMTSEDVKFTFDRLRDPEIGAATVALYSNIVDITAPDEYTVVFTLTNPNPDFLKDLGDYHALIMDAAGTDFATQWNGTGPFILKSYSPEDRIVFERNPNYWLKDADGNQLPYVDGMEFIFIADSTAQVEALRGVRRDSIPPDVGEQRLDEATTALTQAHRRVSTLVREMSNAVPTRLESEGLAAALHSALDHDFRDNFDRVEWHAEPIAVELAKRLPLFASEVIFSAAQEAIRNAAKHGRGGDAQRKLHLDVALQNGAGLQVIIADDGVGRPLDPVDGEAGSGLRFHGAMLAVIGGTLSVGDQSGGGTRVIIETPLS